jgi:lipopolysaccharide export LptBFGC system permease protein LptF
MGIGIIILSAILFGILIGCGIIIFYSFIKTYIQNKRVLKKNPNLVKEIELNKKISKKIQDDRTKRIKEIRERNRRTDGFTNEERINGNNSESGKPDEHISDKENSSKSRGVSLSDTVFNLRD